MNGCETCLFFTEPYPSLYICIARRAKHLPLEMVQDCKDWVEDTPENADKWLARHGFPQADASEFASEFESESDCMIVDLKSK